MLTRESLGGLYRTLRDQSVLSVYIDGGQSDPASRKAWRVRLDKALAEERRRVESEAGDEVEAFDAARQAIDAELGKYDAFLPSAGWAGYATPEALQAATGRDWSTITLFPDTDRGAKPASGSQKTRGMVVCPCST